MTLHLGPHVEYGEMNNFRKNSIQGVLKFFGVDQPLSINLFGNFSSKLAGKQIRFEPRLFKPPAQSLDFRKLAWIQVGPAVVMRIKNFRVEDTSSAQASMNAKAGLPPSYQGVPGISFEWFSQNGRVMLEMIDPDFEIFSEKDAMFERIQLEGLEDEAECNDENFEDAIGGEGEGEGEVNEESNPSSPLELQNMDSEMPSTDDPYGLFPKGLQQHLDQKNERTELSLGTHEKSKQMAEIELMESLHATGEKKPISELFDAPLTLPHPDVLPEADVEKTLSNLLATLVRHGVNIHVCEHFTPMQTYRLVVMKILKEEKVFLELKETNWMQNFMTSESCEECRIDMDKQFTKSREIMEGLCEGLFPDDDPDQNEPLDSTDVPF